jgi:predicted unusual protein kinase regulating ubiquinone biosynthesis (AarF/ABC1/UbiB family)
VALFVVILLSHRQTNIKNGREVYLVVEAFQEQLPHVRQNVKYRRLFSSTTTNNAQTIDRKNNNNLSPPISRRSVNENVNNTVKPRKKKMKPMPVTGYDAKAIEEYYDARPLQVGWRLNRLGLPLLGWYLSLLIDKATGVLDKPSVQRRRGIELRQAFVRSKSVALIKSGQALSLRPDLIKNKAWAEELGKLVDAVGSFSDVEAMNIMKSEFIDLQPRMIKTKDAWQESYKKRKGDAVTRIEKIVANDPVLSLFEFYNGHQAVASASIGQVYKARIRRGPQLEAAIGKEMAARWGGKVVAIKVQRPDVASSASLDMYLLRRTATWLSKMRAGDIVGIADQFGMQLFGELDYIREANNCVRFRELYGEWDNVLVPDVCIPLTR